MLREPWAFVRAKRHSHQRSKFHLCRGLTGSVRENAPTGSRMRGFRQWKWHLDEVHVKINGEMHYLWRAVDEEGEVPAFAGTGSPRMLIARRRRGSERCSVGEWPRAASLLLNDQALQADVQLTTQSRTSRRVGPLTRRRREEPNWPPCLIPNGTMV